MNQNQRKRKEPEDNINVINQTQGDEHENLSSLEKQKIYKSIRSSKIGKIKNKMVREEMFRKLQSDSKRTKRREKKFQQKHNEALGDEAPPKEIPKTIDNTREYDETVIDPNDNETTEDIDFDEFNSYFSGKLPKTLLTTSVGGTKISHLFANELCEIFHNCEYYKRRHYRISEIVDYAKKGDYTNLIILNENNKKVDGFIIGHLPHGPTMSFRLRKLVLSKHIRGHGKRTSHPSELILNGFVTRMGQTVGRMFASLFSQQPDFHGRRVATFHTQRDFIFFRHHRYIFEEKPEGSKKKEPVLTQIQELGPRFVLKLRSIQKGCFDLEKNEYEWIHKTEMDTSRRRFFM